MIWEDGAAEDGGGGMRVGKARKGVVLLHGAGTEEEAV